MEQRTPTHEAQDEHHGLYSRARRDMREMSDRELLSLLFCTTLPEASAERLGHTLYALAESDLHTLARMDAHMLHPTLTERQTFVVMAAIELGRRRDTPTAIKPCIRDSADAYAHLHPMLMDLVHEEFWMLTMDRGGRLIGRDRVSVGGRTGTVADPRIIFKLALDRKACALLVAHNHPSGQLHPSQEDIQLTKKLKEAARFLDIDLRDHLIIAQGPGSYYSFADNGML